MIRALVFDWGGVIQRTEDRGPRGSLDEELGLPSGSVERLVFGSVAWERASKGECGADEAWDEIVASIGYPSGSVAEFVERFFAGDRIDERLVQLIRGLRAKGLSVGLLSNALPGRTKDKSPSGRWGMDGLFDAQVFSYQLGVLKPDKRAYKAILAALRVLAEETLLIDDSPTNVEGALAVGMDALEFVGTCELLAALTRLGLAEFACGGMTA